MKPRILIVVAAVAFALFCSGCMDYVLSLSPEDVAAIKDGVQSAAGEAVEITLENAEGGLSPESAQKIADATAAATTAAVELVLSKVAIPVDLSGWESNVAALILGILTHLGWVRAKASPTGTVFGKSPTPAK